MLDGSKSILEMTYTELVRAGLYKRRSLALHGDPISAGFCREHSLDLAEEEGVLYLCCTKCTWTKFLREKDNPYAKQRKEARENHYRGFRPL